MTTIKIGKITSAVGLGGEVKVTSYSDDSERFSSIESVIIEGRKIVIESTRYKGTAPIIKLDGTNDRNGAEALAGRDIFMDVADLPELEEGQYYVRDIVGFDVVTTEGMRLGVLKDVKTNTAQDLYVIEGTEKEVLIPGVKEFILDVDTSARQITVELPEGLLGL